MDYILLNGSLIPENEHKPGFSWWDSPFIIRQVMWFANGEIPHYDLHMQQFNAVLADFGRSLSPDFPSREELLRLSKRLINKNKAFLGGWLTFHFGFSGALTEYVVTLKRHPERIFPLDPEGKTGRIATTVKYSLNPLSGYPFYSEKIWETEQFRSVKSGGTVALFLNEKGAITETQGANLFCIRKNQLLTPAKETGCIVDIMRDKVILAARVVGFDIVETGTLSPSDLNQMEEIFTVAEGKGFSWLKGIGMKRYKKNNLELIWKQTVVSCFPKVS